MRDGRLLIALTVVGACSCSCHQPVAASIEAGVVMKCDWTSDFGPSPIGPFSGGPSTCQLFLVESAELQEDDVGAAAAWFAALADDGEPLVATQEGLLEHSTAFGSYVACGQPWFGWGCASFEIAPDAPLVLARTLKSSGPLSATWERLGPGPEPRSIDTSFVDEEVVLSCITQLKRESDCAGSSLTTFEAAEACVSVPLGNCDGGLQGHEEYWACLASGSCVDGAWETTGCTELTPSCPPVESGP